MISYRLVCSHGHGFEGWFRNSEAFETQAADGDLVCPVCEDRAIRKDIMAPAVMRGHAAPAGEEATPAQPAAAASAPVPAAGPAVAADPAKLARMLTTLRKLTSYVEENFEDVGERFAEEARKIHHGESEERGIYGQSTAEDIKELHEEGIDVLPLPRLPRLDS